MRVFGRVALVVASCGVATQAIAGGPPELAPTELAQLQSHRYSLPPNKAFSAVLSTLQSLGFVDINADKEAVTYDQFVDPSIWKDANAMVK